MAVATVAKKSRAKKHVPHGVRTPAAPKCMPSGVLSFGSVPVGGGYAGGCRIGEAYAIAYLKHLREKGRSPGGDLGRIAVDMMGVPEAPAARIGRAIGFFNTLDLWIEAAAQRLGTNLDEIELGSLVREVEIGLNERDPA